MERVSELSASSGQPLALVLSDDPFADLGQLTTCRCKAALPFAGKYRLIDFALSNCVHSGVETVGVITQYRPRSLHAHLDYGRPWDLDRRQGGLTLLHPYQARTGMGWYAGSADAVYQNLDYVFHNRADEVFVLTGYGVYCMDLNAMVARHREAKADLTVAVVAVDKGRERYATVVVDDEGHVRRLIPPGDGEPGPLAVMGVLLFSTDALSWRLSEDAQDPSSAHDLIQNVVARMAAAGDRVVAYQHTGYWRNLRTVYDYWAASMDLLSDSPGLNLQDEAWPILTRFEVRPPTRIAIGARVSHSLLSEGCVVEGTVEYSILSPGVYVAPGAVVRNSVLMHNVTVEERAVVENAILDMEVEVGPQARVGHSRRHAPTLNSAPPRLLTVIGKGEHVPAKTVVVPGTVDRGWPLPAHRPARVEADAA